MLEASLTVSDLRPEPAAAAWLSVPAEPLPQRRSHLGWVKPAVTGQWGVGGTEDAYPSTTFTSPSGDDESIWLEFTSVCNVIQIPTDGIRPWRGSWQAPFWGSFP